MRSKLLNPPDAARPMLDHFAALNRRTQAARKEAAEPEVGIFFVYNGRVLVDGTPVSQAESYGNFKGHNVGHDRYWDNLKKVDLVPRDVEYDEVPRGRVGYDTKERKFFIFADPCILKDQRAIDQVERLLHLPSVNMAPPKRDSHYRCPGCMKTQKSTKRLQQEEEDWDF
jgi:hypothetical protein